MNDSKQKDGEQSAFIAEFEAQEAEANEIAHLMDEFLADQFDDKRYEGFRYSIYGLGQALQWALRQYRRKTTEPRFEEQK